MSISVICQEVMANSRRTSYVCFLWHMSLGIHESERSRLNESDPALAAVCFANLGWVYSNLRSCPLGLVELDSEGSVRLANFEKDKKSRNRSYVQISQIYAIFALNPASNYVCERSRV
jgi:predicted transcriptional regulator with HTH domain